MAGLAPAVQSILGKGAKSFTVGNAVLSVPKKRIVGDDGPYRKPTLCKKGQITHCKERS